MKLPINLLLAKNKHSFFIACLLLLCLFSTLVNRLPQGYIIAHGDHAFFPQMSKNYNRFFYLWGNAVNGDGAPVGGDPSTLLQNGFFYILDKLGVSDTQKQNIKFFLFIFLSSISMYVALGVFFRGGVNPITQFIVSIFYAFNGTTIMYISYIGAYLTAHDLHIFLPLIWATFTRGLIDRKNDYLIYSVFLFFLSLGGFQNPAFLFLFFLLLFCTVIFCWITGKIKIKQVLLAGVLFVFYIGVIGFYAFHIINYTFDPPWFLKTDTVEALNFAKQWIKEHARAVITGLRFVYYSGDNFPDYFPYTFLPKELFIFLSFYPALFLPLVFLFKFKNLKKYKDWLFFFAIIYLVLLLLSAKHLLLKDLAYIIFTLPILNALRSWDKFLAMLPFLYSMFLAFLLMGVEGLNNRKQRSFIYSVIIFIILIYPLPFFIGRFHVTFERNHLWGYKYNVLVKTPNYYKEIADYINKDKGLYKILTMPYGGQIGKGWVLYSSWKYIGVDYTTLYINNPTLSPIPANFQFQYALYLHENPNEATDSFLNLIRVKAIRYLIINNDTGKEYLSSFRNPFSMIKENFTFIKRFGNLDLYRISPERELPVIYTSESRFASITPKDTTDSIFFAARTKYMAIKPLVFTIEPKLKEQKKNIKRINSFILKDSNLLDLALELADCYYVTKDTKINLENPAKSEVYFDSSVLKNEIPKFELKIDNSRIVDATGLKILTNRRFIKLADIELSKGRHIITFTTLNNVNQAEKNMNLRFLIVNYEARLKAEKFILQKINQPETELCYILEKQRGSFYVP